MNRVTPRNVKDKMVQALALIKEAVNMSVPFLKTNQRNSIVTLWEVFIREIILYIRLRSKETGTNLIGNISLKRIWPK